MADPFTLMGIGELLWDTFPDSRELGGAPANFAFHANALGGRGIVISCIGNDREGEEIQAVLDQKKIPYFLSRDLIHPTGKVSVRTDANGVPDYIIHENAAWDFLTFAPGFTQLAARADAVCFGSLAQRNPVAGKTIQKFIQSTRKTCLKLFDINLRQHFYSKENICDLLHLSDVLKLNHEELSVIRQMFLTKKTDTGCLAELTQRFSLKLVVLTRGRDGSRLFMDKHRDSLYTSVPVDIADTVGAGDSFSAVVALGLLKGCSLDDINRLANRVAAYVCSQKGATPVIPEALIQWAD